MSWFARAIANHREQMSAAKNRRPDALLTEVQRQSSMSRAPRCVRCGNQVFSLDRKRVCVYRLPPGDPMSRPIGRSGRPSDTDR